MFSNNHNKDFFLGIHSIYNSNLYQRVLSEWKLQEVNSRAIALICPNSKLTNG